MIKKVFKYPITAIDVFTIALPKGAQILTVQVQNGNPFIWALVDPYAKTSERTFRIVGTGQDIIIDDSDPYAFELLHHIGTFQLSGGALVIHLFETSTVQRQ